MKSLTMLLFAALVFLSRTQTSLAANVSGSVFCDANHDGVIDTNDAGLPNVLVVITNQNNSFSNATVTAADGSFSLTIPDFDPLAARRDPLSQVYVETLDASSLPISSAILFPLAITYLSPTPAWYISPGANPTDPVSYTS